MKQVLVIRKDLELSKGKLCSQAAHASVEAALQSDPKLVDRWRKVGAKKVVLKVENESELKKIKQQAAKEKLTAVIISDAGLTEIPAGTKTAVGIGPDEDKKIDKITGKLSLL